LPLWIPIKDNAPHQINTILDDINQKDEQERRRLLYVALTRASDRLYIMGFDKYKKPQANNWYDLILNSLGMQETKEKITFHCPQKTSVVSKTQKEIPYDFDTLPQWAKTMPLPDKKTPVLSPSKMGIFEKDEENAVGLTQALEKGIFIHKMLQYLPTLSKEKREQFLTNFTPKDMQVPYQLLQLIDNPEIKDLFGPDSLAEVPVIGWLDNQKIAGQIDRLVVRKKDVLIIDYKTNKIVPDTVPENYKAQLSAYRDLIKKIFPDKIIKTYLLWTENLTLTEVK
jgi:ATP-dependent helicase/nuclease subunit A